MVKSYGDALPDQADRIASLSTAEVGLITDIREMFKERASLEKEYAMKLSALTKKASDRKAKRMSSLVVGDEPMKAWGDDTLRRSSLDNAYSQLIASVENTAQDHSALSDALISQVADAMKALEKKHDDMKSKQVQFYQRVLADRDRIYGERVKAKQKYDEEALEIDAYRRKQDRSQDDKHASRAAKQYESQVVDMQNSKNSYLIAIDIANKTKNRFYTVDLPLIENDFQRLQANLISGLISLVRQAQAVHTNHLTSLQSRISSAQSAILQVDPSRDQDLFIEYNTRPFSVPADWGWEPCPGYYDTAEIVVEPGPKVFLQNKLQRSRAKLQEASSLIDSKSREVQKLSAIVDTYTKDRNLGDVDDVTNNYLDAQQQLTLLDVSASALQAEVDAISAALGGDEGSQNPHSFKSASFSIPTTCGYCKASIWGLSKQGKTCKSCGLSVHSKCELKVPADCGSGGRSRTSLDTNLSRADSRASTTSTASSMRTPAAASSFSRPHAIPDETYPLARVVYDFSPTSPFELAVSEGMIVQVIEEDDGSGWVKVAEAKAGKGLVPAAYIELADEEDESQAPPVLPTHTNPAIRRVLGSGRYVRGLYTYQANGPDEISIEEGDMIELSAGPEGGTEYAEGWWEGYDVTGKKGIFPSNYVELA